jgi:polysaccharide export outer membrane protein
MEELREQTVRVSGDGTISLPLIGLMQVAGLTETGVGDELRRRLEERYMYNPQVNLFVTEYRSRQVAVIGQVGKPGLYSLASDSDTLLDVLSQAGGVTVEAAPRVLFIPAEPGKGKNVRELATALPVALDGRDSSPPVLKNTNPIVIDLQDLARGGDQMLLTLPARPGDVLVVPGRGEVLVQGWVKAPASYKITPGLTVLGAVAAAGGLLYAADASTVQIIRSGKKGEKILLAANLDTIKRGESPDFPVEPGDVIEVAYSNAKIVPYGIYSFFTSIIRVGANVTYY